MFFLISLGGPTIVKKGATDIISDLEGFSDRFLVFYLFFSGTVEVSYGGSARRCGGQGDVLAGVTATFACWTSTFLSRRGEGGGSGGAGGSESLTTVFEELLKRYMT
jgi:hypothetical protein